MILEDRRYEHRFHAGNIGDVWKHVALVALLLRLRQAERPLVFVDTHAGAGRYPLASTGEWTEGIGKIRGKAAGAPPAVARYLEIAGEAGVYPGSPRIAAALLGSKDPILAYELVAATGSDLGAALGDHPNAKVENGDGLEGLARVLAAPSEGSRVVLIDPPYEDRREWQDVPDALIAMKDRLAGTSTILWYPIKSYARPNAMLARFEKAGLAGTALELLTSPLNLKKNRLNGSGVILFDPPPGLVEELASLAAWLGPHLALFGRFYTLRCVAF